MRGVSRSLRSPPAAPTKVTHAQYRAESLGSGDAPASVLSRPRAGGCRFDLDMAELVEVERDQLAVVLAQRQAVEPELFILRVGVPASRLFLLISQHDPADVARPRVVAR